MGVRSGGRSHKDSILPGAGVTVPPVGAHVRPLIEYCGADRCRGLNETPYAPGPGTSFVPVSSVLPNFSRALSEYRGARRTVDTDDVPGVSILKYAPGPCAHEERHESGG
jgi:hypothetical protein